MRLLTPSREATAYFIAVEKPWADRFWTPRPPSNAVPFVQTQSSPSANLSMSAAGLSASSHRSANTTPSFIHHAIAASCRIPFIHLLSLFPDNRKCCCPCLHQPAGTINPLAQPPPSTYTASKKLNNLTNTSPELLSRNEIRPLFSR